MTAGISTLDTRGHFGTLISFLRYQWQWFGRGRAVSPVTLPPELRQERFTLCLISLAAKLMQVDGTARREEILAFRALFQTSTGGHEKMVQLFARASNDTRDAIHDAREIVALFGGNLPLMEELMERLMRIATADAGLNAAEVKFLKITGRALGLTRHSVKAILSRHSLATTMADPYAVLGVTPQADAEELRRIWRQKVREFHPDHLRAQGLQTGHITLAEARLRSINEAYDTIHRKRSVKKAA